MSDEFTPNVAVDEKESSLLDLLKSVVESHHFRTHQDRLDAEKHLRKLRGEPEPKEDEGPVDYQKKYEELLAKGDNDAG